MGTAAHWHAVVSRLRKLVAPGGCGGGGPISRLAVSTLTTLFLRDRVTIGRGEGGAMGRTYLGGWLVRAGFPARGPDGVLTRGACLSLPLTLISITHTSTK